MGTMKSVSPEYLRDVGVPARCQVQGLATRVHAHGHQKVKEGHWGKESDTGYAAGPCLSPSKQGQEDPQ